MEETLKQDKPNLRRQIAFVNGARKVLSTLEKSEVRLDASNLEMLKSIEENLIVIKNWMELPEYHQAALQTLDESYRLMQVLEGQGEMTASINDFVSQIAAEVLSAQSDDASTTPAESVKRIASLSIIAIAKFIIKKEVNNG